LQDPEEDGDEIPDERFYHQPSSATCSFSDIKGFIYGGTSSRFWMMRKHINLLKDPENAQFFAWECITLELRNRTIDLVIKDEKIMSCFIKLLIFNLKSCDGNRDSAKPLVDQLYAEYISRAKENH
jgi:hypothetical protein